MKELKSPETKLNKLGCCCRVYACLFTRFIVDASTESECGSCKDHKVPRDNQLGRASWHQASPMASLYHSNASNSQDPRANSCNYSPHCVLQARADSICDQWPPHLPQTLTKMAEEIPAHKSSSPFESSSISQSSSYNHPPSISPNP